MRGFRWASCGGGTPSSRRAQVRESVGTFVQQAAGVAGINGTFFADARLIGTGCTLIGPAQAASDTEFQPETDKYRLTRIGNRPIIIWGPKQIAIFPFNAGTMNNQEVFKSYMPDYTDLFLAGAWLVHNGKPRAEEELKPIAAGDFQDTRRRAFFGITATGEPVLGATPTVVSSTKMAEAAVEAGVQEAVLLDSGFSTSLVYDKKIIVTGHTDKNLPRARSPRDRRHGHAGAAHGPAERGGAEGCGSRRDPDRRRRRDETRTARTRTAQQTLNSVGDPVATRWLRGAAEGEWPPGRARAIAAGVRKTPAAHRPLPSGPPPATAAAGDRHPSRTTCRRRSDPDKQ